MRTLFLSGLACLALGLAARAQEDTARDILARAVKAHGGDKLAQLRAVQVKTKGTIDLLGGIPFTSEAHVQFPDKLRSTVNARANNMDLVITQVFDGRKFWFHFLGQTKEFDDDKLLKELRENVYAERVGSLAGLLTDKGYQFSPLGEIKVDDRPAVGVRVSSRGHRDVNLYFDKASHLLVKSEYRAVDPMTQKEMTQEKFFSGYKEIQGVQAATKVVVHQDGKRFMSAETTEVRFADGFDDSIFARP